MRIMDIIAARSQKRGAERLPVIAFLGDSVTQGSFELFFDDKGGGDTIFEQDCCYGAYLSKIFKTLYPAVPIVTINAGVSGDNVVNANTRLERDVLTFHPDLTIVCFGLNDCTKELEHLSEYAEGLRSIFTKLKEAGSEVIFMTPNMMNTYVSHFIEDLDIRKIATNTMRLQNAGVLDAYLTEGKKVAEECGVVICDVYEKWKSLYRCGADVTNMLSNYINHPTREMNWLFAYSLAETMFCERE